MAIFCIHRRLHTPSPYIDTQKRTQLEICKSIWENAFRCLLRPFSLPSATRVRIFCSRLVSALGATLSHSRGPSPSPIREARACYRSCLHLLSVLLLQTAFAVPSVPSRVPPHVPSRFPFLRSSFCDSHFKSCYGRSFLLRLLLLHASVGRASLPF